MIADSRPSATDDSSLQFGTCAATAPGAIGAADTGSRIVAQSTARDLAEIFRALGDPTRVRMLSALADAEVCVGDLAGALGMGQSAVSHQLSYLREMGLVTARRAGKHVFYKLDDDHVRVLFAQGLEHVTHG
jgi:ArsR family transcriptional regulator, lead/cadmium/zinc/bismuth-responsive transcriptional repressor